MPDIKGRPFIFNEVYAGFYIIFIKINNKIPNSHIPGSLVANKFLFKFYADPHYVHTHRRKSYANFPTTSMGVLLCEIFQ